MFTPTFGYGAPPVQSGECGPSPDGYFPQLEIFLVAVVKRFFRFQLQFWQVAEFGWVAQQLPRSTLSPSRRRHELEVRGGAHQQTF